MFKTEAPGSPVTTGEPLALTIIYGKEPRKSISLTWETAMIRKHADFDPCEVEALILRSLVRKLVEKSVLSEDDVHSILQSTVKGLDIAVPFTVGTQAANDITIE